MFVIEYVFCFAKSSCDSKSNPNSLLLFRAKPRRREEAEGREETLSSAKAEFPTDR